MFWNKKDKFKDGGIVERVGFVTLEKFNKEMNELNNTIRLICQHKDNSLESEHVKEYSLGFCIRDKEHFYKRCNICKHREEVTKKQYLTYQIETAKSSLKECE